MCALVVWCVHSKLFIYNPLHTYKIARIPQQVRLSPVTTIQNSQAVVASQLLLERRKFLDRHVFVPCDARLQDVDLENGVFIVLTHLFVLGLAVPLALVALLLLLQPFVFVVEPSLKGCVKGREMKTRAWSTSGKTLERESERK
jgi:hypothetical protein